MGILSSTATKVQFAAPDMAKKSKQTRNPSQSAPDTRPCRMFPEYHEDVAEAVSHECPSVWFCERNGKANAIHEYETHIMGRFNCANNTCSTKGWGSKKVAIVIRGFTRDGYNAEVFNQRCRACRQLGSMIIDESSYVERVAYRVQKWAGVELAQPYYSSKKGKPHRRDLCEGCRLGVCQERDD